MSGRHVRTAPAASQSLLTGAGLLATARYVVAVMGWIGSAIVARRLTSDEFGAFTTVFSLLGLVGLLSELRMSRLVLGAIGTADDDEAGRVVGSYVALRIVVGFAGYFVALLVAVVGDFDDSVVRGTALGGTILVILSTWYALILLFQARMWLRSIAMSQVVGMVVQLAGVIAVAVAGLNTVVWFTLPAVVNACVGLAWVSVAAHRVLRVRLSVDLTTWWTWLKEAAPLAMGYALETVYFRIDVLMLSLMSATLAPVGLYGIGYKFSDLVGSLPMALLGPALALMVAAYGVHTDRFHRTFRTTLIVLFVVGVGVGIGFALFAEEAIRLLYGERYTPGAGAARLLVTGQVLHFFTSLCFTTLIAAGRNRLYPLAAVIGVVVNVGLNLLLIPEYSYQGSAVATIITEVLVLAILFGGIVRIPGVRPWPTRALARTLLGGALLAAGLLVLRPLVPWPVLAALSPFVYLGLLHVLAIDGPGGLRVLARDARLETLGRQPDGDPPEGPPGSQGVIAESDPRRDPGGGPFASGGADDHTPRPLRLVAVSPTGLVSGAEVVLLRGLEAAAREGDDVCCLSPEGALTDRLAAVGARRVPIPDLRMPVGSRVIGLPALVLRSIRAARRLRRAADGADVVLVNGLHALLAVRLARLRVPVAWLVHDVIVRKDRLAFARLGAPAVDLAIAVSDAVAAPLRRLGIETTVVRNGTTWPVEPAHRADGRRVIGCNAVLSPWKGHDILLEAVARLGRDDVVVELLGPTFPRDETYAASLRERAERADLRGQVRFLGRRDDPLEVMRGWTIAVSSSVDPEAAPLNVLEAMSLGVPLVGTDHGGTPEVLGDAGLLVPPGDPDAMADAIRRLLDDPERYACCAAAGPAAIETGLTLDRHRRELLGALRGLAERTATPGLIVFVTPDFEPTAGGTTSQIAAQARALRARGHDVVVLTQRLERGWPRAEVRGGLSVRRFGPSGRGSLAMKALLLRVAWWLRRRRHRITAVHVIMYPDFALAARLAGLGKRTVMVWAGLGDATDTLGRIPDLLRRVLRGARRRALARVSHVALTPALSAELALHGLTRAVSIVPTAVDTVRFRPPTAEERATARRAIGIADDEVALVYTGHLRSLKRVDRIVDALARLVAGGHPVRLVVVGGGRADLDDCTDELRAQVRRLGLESRVVFTGVVDDVERYLQACDVFVLTSDREGLPNSLLEAMAVGLPSVATATAAGSQVLDPETGIVPISTDPETIAAAIERLVADRELRTTMGAAARRASARYALPVVVQRYEEMYARFAEGAGLHFPTMTASATVAPDTERPAGASPNENTEPFPPTSQ